MGWRNSARLTATSTPSLISWLGMDTSLATETGPRQRVLKSLALSTPPAPPAQRLSIALAMARVPQSLALAMALVPQSLAPVLQSLARKSRLPTDLF